MELWLFFTIFGAVIFIPSGALFLLLQRFKNTIVVLIKENGALTKIVITNKILEKGEITQIGKRKIEPIKISKDEIYFGKWRRWIIKPELHSKEKRILTNKEIEGYLNNEDLIKLYLAGKFKEQLMMFIYVILFAVVIGIVINIYINNAQVFLSYNNQTALFIKENAKQAFIEVMYNVTG